ncbi:stage II sporulation protein D [uncultured Clostridium sp.]|uniref:stage II sporulation protein D n=1 Tax=uncultured Clostridium sp. TaxID=59620 RepID=UPI00260B9497|nr:stage II sporulation protein D [uncultured Clostridium sp.]
MNNRQMKENVITMGIVTIAIVLCLIMIPKLILGDSINIGESKEVSEEKNKKNTDTINVAGNEKVTVYRAKTGKTDKVNLEDYVIGVVSGEMPVNFSEEAIKSQAIAARTYYFSKREAKCEQAKGADICDTIHCQVYMDKKERLNAWDKKYANKNYSKIEKLVNNTKGLVITHSNEIIKYPQFFSTSWGKTENSEEVFSAAVPYLKSIKSPGEEVSPRFTEEKIFANSEFVAIANNKLNSNITTDKINTKIEILNRTNGGSVAELKIGGTVVKGKEFRQAYEINSANFTIEYFKDKVKIITKGFGHGVGMSQWGANVMAQNGANYDEILTHYYTGVEIKKIKYKD